MDIILKKLYTEKNNIYILQRMLLSGYKWLKTCVVTGTRYKLSRQTTRTMPSCKYNFYTSLSVYSEEQNVHSHILVNSSCIKRSDDVGAHPNPALGVCTATRKFTFSMSSMFAMVPRQPTTKGVERWAPTTAPCASRLKVNNRSKSGEERSWHCKRQKTKQVFNWKQRTDIPKVIGNKCVTG